jgi:hypothetical protein
MASFLDQTHQLWANNTILALCDQQQLQVGCQLLMDYLHLCLEMNLQGYHQAGQG